MLRALDNGAAGLAQYAGPGGWNDPDMLEVRGGGAGVNYQHTLEGERIRVGVRVEQPLHSDGGGIVHLLDDCLKIGRW